MKALFLTIVASATLNLQAATLKDLAGSFDVKSSIASGIATFKEDGTLEADIYGLVYFQCYGDKGKVEENVFEFNSTCYNIPTVIKIDLSKVTNFNTFSAPVFTVIGGNMMMEFTRR